jgi:hypothetical protein
MVFHTMEAGAGASKNGIIPSPGFAPREPWSLSTPVRSVGISGNRIREQDGGAIIIEHVGPVGCDAPPPRYNETSQELTRERVHP